MFQSHHLLLVHSNGLFNTLKVRTPSLDLIPLSKHHHLISSFFLSLNFLFFILTVILRHFLRANQNSSLRYALSPLPPSLITLFQLKKPWEHVARLANAWKPFEPGRKSYPKSVSRSRILLLGASFFLDWGRCKIKLRLYCVIPVMSLDIAGLKVGVE